MNQEKSLGKLLSLTTSRSDHYRATLHPILHSRIGPDQFVSRMARLREDPRFKAVQPDAFDIEENADNQLVDKEEDLDEGLELWFDWAFVDFWKNHYCEYTPSM